MTEDSGLRNAIKDALHDASGFYELTISMPVDCDRLNLQVRTEENAGPAYRVNAQAYERGRRPPALIILNEQGR